MIQLKSLYDNPFKFTLFVFAIGLGIPSNPASAGGDSKVKIKVECLYQNAGEELKTRAIPLLPKQYSVITAQYHSERGAFLIDPREEEKLEKLCRRAVNDAGIERPYRYRKPQYRGLSAKKQIGFISSPFSHPLLGNALCLASQPLPFLKNSENLSSIEELAGTIDAFTHELQYCEKFKEGNFSDKDQNLTKLKTKLKIAKDKYIDIDKEFNDGEKRLKEKKLLRKQKSINAKELSESENWMKVNKQYLIASKKEVEKATHELQVYTTRKNEEQQQLDVRVETLKEKLDFLKDNPLQIDLSKIDAPNDPSLSDSENFQNFMTQLLVGGDSESEDYGPKLAKLILENPHFFQLINPDYPHFGSVLSHLQQIGVSPKALESIYGPNGRTLRASLEKSRNELIALAKKDPSALQSPEKLNALLKPVVQNINRWIEKVKFADFVPPSRFENGSYNFNNVFSIYWETADLSARRKMLSGFWKGGENNTKGKRQVEMANSAGPIFIKLMQSEPPGSADPDIEEGLGNLKDKGLAMSQADQHSELDKSLGGRVNRAKMFQKFDKDPINAASIAQVHFAELPGSQKQIVVKVRRKGVVNAVNSDRNFIQAFPRIIQLMDKIKPKDRALMQRMFETIAHPVLDETDFNLEAESQMKGYKAYHKKGPVRVVKPLVLSKLKSDSAFFMERAKGQSLKGIDDETQDLDYLLAKKEALTGLLGVWLKEAMDGSGFFHADLHSGNIFINYDKAHPEKTTLEIFDFGSHGTLQQKDKDYFLKSTLAMYKGSLPDVMAALGYQPKRDSQDPEWSNFFNFLKTTLADKEIDSKTRVANLLIYLGASNLPLPQNFGKFVKGLFNIMSQIGPMEDVIKAKIDQMTDPADAKKRKRYQSKAEGVSAFFSSAEWILGKKLGLTVAKGYIKVSAKSRARKMGLVPKMKMPEEIPEEMPEEIPEEN